MEENLETLTFAPGTIAEPVTVEPEVPAKLTRKQLGQLRRQYLTITHGTVRACKHKAKFAKDKDPKNNCVSCWSAYFMTSVDLEFIHAVLTQKGSKALIAMKGIKFVKHFHGFLAGHLLPALAAEINKEKEESAAQIQGGTFGNTTTGNEVQATGSAE